MPCNLLFVMVFRLRDKYPDKNIKNCSFLICCIPSLIFSTDKKKGTINNSPLWLDIGRRINFRDGEYGKPVRNMSNGPIFQAQSSKRNLVESSVLSWLVARRCNFKIRQNTRRKTVLANGYCSTL